MAEFITANWQMLAFAAVGVVVALGGAIVLLLWTELRKPTPRTGTPVTLPNGMRIQQWQKSETDFLYEEIWGRESAYSKEDKIVFEPGATIVDAGANIGMFSLYAAARCKGDAAIYAFEPIDTTYAVLRANAEAATNGAFEETFRPGPKASLKITAINKGLSDKPADVVFEHHPNFSVWSTQDAKFAVERLDRIAEDLPRATANSSNPLLRLIPASLVAWIGRKFLSKAGQTVKVKAQLVPLSSVIDEAGIKRIDVLKVDVEGAEVAVLAGVRDEHWRMVQQVVLEVESFALRDQVCGLLGRKGFTCSWVASERERSPGVLSEVCMVYAARPEFRNPAAGASASKH